jgi:hypothetical protein
MECLRSSQPSLDSLQAEYLTASQTLSFAKLNYKYISIIIYLTLHITKQVIFNWMVEQSALARVDTSVEGSTIDAYVRHDGPRARLSLTIDAPNVRHNSPRARLSYLYNALQFQHLEEQHSSLVRSPAGFTLDTVQSQ